LSANGGTLFAVHKRATKKFDAHILQKMNNKKLCRSFMSDKAKAEEQE
jgi:hypothetical protein